MCSSDLAHTSLAGITWTKNYLILNKLEDVKTRLVVLDPAKNWAEKPLEDVPANSTASVAAVDPDENDDLWLTANDYTLPTTLYHTRVGGTPTALKSLPAFYDASDITVAQHFAKSDDGTEIPYFIVHHKNLPLDGKNPTLLYGYGGFEISLTPGYAAGVGKAWLNRRTQDGRGGVYVVANIRGGGEYGPRWQLRDRKSVV